MRNHPARWELIEDELNFLKNKIPDWVSFRIDDAGEHLGFWVGPNIRHRLWKKAEDRWDARGRAIADARIAPCLGVRLYNS